MRGVCLLPVFVLVFTMFACAASVRVLEPVEFTMAGGSGQVIDLGTVGPGQKVELVVGNGTGEVSRQNQTLSQKEANWNALEVERDSLPAGWRGQDSGENEAPLKAYIIVAPNAGDGEYGFRLNAVDSGEGVATVSFKAKATVSRKVFSFSIASDPVKVRTGDTAEYVLQLSNSGNANDFFEVTATGVPGSQPFLKQVFVGRNSKVNVKVPATIRESGAYPLEFSAKSLSSDVISGTERTTLFSGSDFLTDAMAAGRGVLLFPSTESAAYSLWALIGSILGYRG